MSYSRLEFTVKPGNRWPRFLYTTVVVFLFLVIIIQPMGPVIGCITLGLFAAAWIWYLVSVVRSSINAPRLLVLDGEGAELTKRLGAVRLAWGDIDMAMETVVPVSPRQRSRLREITLVSEQTRGEISFGNMTLRSADGRKPDESYSLAKEFIREHLPAERLSLLDKREAKKEEE